VVGDVNERTQGTEFYGTSSNFVLLNQLFAFARQHHPSRHGSSNSHDITPSLFPTSVVNRDEYLTSSGHHLSTSDAHNSGPGIANLSQDRVSIINLLSNEEVLSPVSGPKTPLRVTSDQQVNPGDPGVISGLAMNGRSASTVRESSIAAPNSTQDEHTTNPAAQSSTTIGRNHQNSTTSPTEIANRRLEQVYIQAFLDNLHHLHPMLDPVLFEEQCERHVWGTQTRIEKQKCSRHFLALYNIVVAVGALVAGAAVVKNLGRDMQLCAAQFAQTENSKSVFSSQTISRTYFRKSKDLLGDVSEVCSLESAQTLLLMVTIRCSAYNDVR
jgi:hypothetical protein